MSNERVENYVRKSPDFYEKSDKTKSLLFNCNVLLIIKKVLKQH